MRSPHTTFVYRSPVESAHKKSVAVHERANIRGFRVIVRDETPADLEARDDVVAARCSRIMRRLVLLELPAIDEVERLLDRLGA